MSSLNNTNNDRIRQEKIDSTPVKIVGTGDHFNGDIGIGEWFDCNGEEWKIQSEYDGSDKEAVLKKLTDNSVADGTVFSYNGVKYLKHNGTIYNIVENKNWFATWTKSS